MCDCKIDGGRGDLILADEPTGALDHEMGIAIMELLEMLNKRGKTLIVITHDPRDRKSGGSCDTSCRWTNIGGSKVRNNLGKVTLMISILLCFGGLTACESAKEKNISYVGDTANICIFRIVIWKNGK